LSLVGFVVNWSIGHLILAVKPFASSCSIKVAFYEIVVLVFSGFSCFLFDFGVLGISVYSTGIEHSFMGLFFLFCLS
jgi:hypothetical protein